MFYPHVMLSAEDDRRVVECIREAERRTSGEIRVHFDSIAEGDVFAEAKRVFELLGMHQTIRRNGVLIFVAPRMRRFVVIGDKGIHSLVPEGFWDDVARLIESYFVQKKWAEGLCAGIKRIADEMAKHFPPVEGDVNELSDEISYGE